MANEVDNLTLQLLREIRADVADIKKVQAEHSVILKDHSSILSEQSAAISGLLDIMHAIHSRVSRIEKQNAPQPA